MSYDPSSVQSIDQIFKREICETFCPQWQVQCHSLPCYHCTTADVDALIESLDAFENPGKVELVIAVLCNRVRMEELRFTDAGLTDFFQRRLRVQCKDRELHVKQK